MQRRHKFLWMKGKAEWDYNQDGRFNKPKIQKNEKLICSKRKRRYFKNEMIKEIKNYEKEMRTS